MYYKVKVEFEIPKENGQMKKQKSSYLVEADGVTEAEKITLEKLSDSVYDHYVVSATEDRIEDIFLNK